MEKMPPIEKLSMKEGKPEIITDQEQFRQIMQGFWHREIDPTVLKKELEEKEVRLVDELLKSGAEMAALLRSMRDEKEQERGEIMPAADKKSFLLASQNKIKREMVAKSAEKAGLSIQETLFGPSAEEEKIEHQILKQIIKEAKRKGRYLSAIRQTYFAIEMAGAKASKMRETFKNRVIMAADTVVLKGGQILEKPENKEEAIQILKKTSGKGVKISPGVVLLTPTSFGKTILLKEGARLTIKLRQFSEAEAEQYLEEVGENYRNVVGVLDYANPLTQRLISDKPVKVEVLEFGRKVGEKPKVVYISPNMLPQLKDYFMGVPDELIREMLSQSKILLKSEIHE